MATNKLCGICNLEITGDQTKIVGFNMLIMGFNQSEGQVVGRFHDIFQLPQNMNLHMHCLLEHVSKIPATIRKKNNEVSTLPEGNTEQRTYSRPSQPAPGGFDNRQPRIKQPGGNGGTGRFRRP